MIKTLKGLKKAIKFGDKPYNVLRKYEMLRGGSGQISKAAFLLFMKDESMLSGIELGRFSNPINIRDALTLKTDLFSEVEGVMTFIGKHINKAYVITGKPQRDELWDYPLDGIREIVVNMIVHRDYADSSDSIIKIFNDRIEFFNPGRLPYDLTVGKLLAGDYVSKIRNKQIATLFKEVKLVEKYGSGIRRICGAFSGNGNKMPAFENFQHGFRVIALSRTAQETAQEIKMSGRSHIEAKIIDAIARNPAITIRDLCSILDKGDNMVKQYLRKLKLAGRIEREGSTKKGSWKVIVNQFKPSTF
jgi:ATP-dependent DNA helicase RecG